MDNSKLIKRLRTELDLPDSFTNEEVLSFASETFHGACINLGMAVEDLKNEFMITVDEAIEKIRKACKR